MEQPNENNVVPNTRLALNGSVERVTYFNPDTGQCVLEIKPESEEEVVLISGRTPWVYPGLCIHVLLEANPKAQLPLHAQQIIFSAPKNRKNLKRFLRSDAVPGIGPKLAQVLANAFPQNLFSILNDAPEKILETEGVGKKKLQLILENWSYYNQKIEFQNYLFAENLPLSWSEALWSKHLTNSLQFFKTFPYQCVVEHDLSFEIVDRYAIRKGFSLESTERLRCGLINVMQNHYKQGHCAFPESQVLAETCIQLEVSQSQLEEILEIEILEDNIIVDQIRDVTCLYLKSVWLMEQDVAARLLKFVQREPSWGLFNVDKVLNWAQSILNIELAPLQKEAIETALNSSLTVITGGPGTGKTTLIRSLVTILQTQFLKFALCSPTGRAAQRLGEATGVPAQTIHRLLKFDALTGKFKFNQSHPLDYDLVLVDESSMVDLQLMSDLLNALPENCALILVGDADQLPSVGAGNVLHSLISSDYFEVVRLTSIYRQSENSLIKVNAKRINEGLMPLPNPSHRGDFHFIPVKNVQDAKSVLFDLIKNIIPRTYGITNLADYQILVPMNKGALGTQQLNEELQGQLGKINNVDESRGTFEFGQNFKLQDKVMVIKNDYKKDVFNGDVGFIEKINYDERYLEVQFGERLVRFEFYEMDRLTLAYAISIHKSQGSEYRAVIVIITNEHLPMAQRHLIYTAVTRGKEHVFLVADPLALQSGLQEIGERWEKLTELLKNTSQKIFYKNSDMALNLLGL